MVLLRTVVFYTFVQVSGYKGATQTLTDHIDRVHDIINVRFRRAMSVRREIILSVEQNHCTVSECADCTRLSSCSATASVDSGLVLGGKTRPPSSRTWCETETKVYVLHYAVCHGVDGVSMGLGLHCSSMWERSLISFLWPPPPRSPCGHRLLLDDGCVGGSEKHQFI